MGLYSELPVYKATYDLLLAVFQFTKGFAKEYKYTVGESLKKETIDLLTLIYGPMLNEIKWRFYKRPESELKSFVYL